MKQHHCGGTDWAAVMGVSLALTEYGPEILQAAAGGDLPEDWSCLNDGARNYATDLAAAIVVQGDAARQRVWAICASPETASWFAARGYYTPGADPFIYLGEIVLRAGASRRAGAQKVGRLRLVYSTRQEMQKQPSGSVDHRKKNDEKLTGLKSDRDY